MGTRRRSAVATRTATTRSAVATSHPRTTSELPPKTLDSPKKMPRNSPENSPREDLSISSSPPLEYPRDSMAFYMPDIRKLKPGLGQVNFPNQFYTKNKVKVFFYSKPL